MLSQLKTYKKKTILLETLQSWCTGMDYPAFHQVVTDLTQQGILSPVKAQGTDYAGLARKYTVHKGPLFASSAHLIQQDALELHISGALDLSWYIQQPLDVWQRDKAAICQISRFLAQPQRPPASLQQRSYDLFHDEKRLLNDPGLLTRLGLTPDSLAIVPEAEPLMLAFNPVSGSRLHHHLIIENKAPWTALLPQLRKTPLTTLIFGSGWKIVGNICQLPLQCGYSEEEHTCWYFGDFDWEGLKIWHQLSAAPFSIHLAVPFYAAFLHHSPSRGKTYQEPDNKALEAFLAEFPAAGRQSFASLLAKGLYYPQEALSPEELLACVKELPYGT